jgi:hypothetical protein
MVMKKLIRITILVVLFFVGGCNPASPTFVSTSPSIGTAIAPSQTVSLVSIFTPSWTDSQVPTIDQTNAQTSGYRKGCITIDANPSHGFLTKGNIILWDEDVNGKVNLSLLTTVDNSISPITDSDTANQIVSPDGMHLAQNEETSINGHISASLSVLTADGQQQVSIPIDQSWVGPLYWLENNQVVYMARPASEIVVNTLTRQITKLDYSSPKFSVYNKSVPRYDSTLNRMVFQRHAPSEFVSLVLWDLSGERELWWATIGDQLWYIQPNWSPDGSQFVVGIPPELYAPVFQLIVVNRDGKAKQLTNFQGSDSQELTVYQPQWSPDGRYIAFWLAGSLSVYDTLAETTTDYCLPVEDPISAKPFWSPDSQQIVFNIEEPNQNVARVIVVDIKKGQAVEVAKSYIVIGWMAPTP